MEAYIEVAARHGLTGEAALTFACKQLEREERRLEREREKEKEEREEKAKEREREEREKERKHELELARLRAPSETSADTERPRRGTVTGPKMPTFDEEKDKMDAYIKRFERHARLNDWPEHQWAGHLSALLTGKALETYSRLSEEQAELYEDLKAALLERYGLTAEGYRLKLRNILPETDESPSQFLSRLESYLARWIELSGTDASYEGLFDLIVTEQFLESCPDSLEVYLKEKGCKVSAELVEHAAQYLVAHGKTLESMPRRSVGKSMASATALATSSGYLGQACLFCDYQHATSKCRKVKHMTITDRRDRLIRAGACFWCLEPRHRAAECPSNRPRCERCSGPHHSLLCERSASRTVNTAQLETSATEPPSNPTVIAASANGASAGCNGAILMQTARVYAMGETDRKVVRVMLDTGSNQSFVTSVVADQLHCQQLALDDMNVQSFGGGQTKQKMRKVQISLKGLSDGTPPLAITAYVVPTICSSPPRAEPAIRRHAHLKGLQLAEPVTLEGEDSTISVLIGQDYMREVIDGRMKIGTAGPIALGSRFGWIISGPSGSGEATQAAASNFIRAEKAEDLLQDLWSLEKVGISTEEADGKDRIRCDDEVERSFEETLERLPNGRYQVCWPWKEGMRASVPTNELLASTRLNACERSLKKKGRLNEYDDAIQSYLDGCHAEKAPAVPDGSVHILAHQAVYKKNKVRVVFDAAAGQPSALNDHINAGPNLIADLTGLLIRFRFRRVGLVADLEKAFLQVALHPADRDVTRFLWRERAKDPVPTTYRMTRVIFGVNASPFLLQATIRHHLKLYEQSDPELVTLLRRDIYCDDLITSVNTEEEAEEVKVRTQDVFLDAGMIMTKWDRSASGETAERNLGDCGETDRKVLGVTWQPASDVLEMCTRTIAEYAAALPETKRTILKIAAAFYDPLGLMAAFSVRVKMLLRVLWRQGLDWDEPITSESRLQWRKWLAELTQLVAFRVSRFYGRHNEVFQLHVFCDASKDALAAVVYIRSSTDAPAQETALVICKTRLAPSQGLSIPRLELTAALIGARLLNFVKKHLPIAPSGEFLWTDSSVTLHWIRSNALRWGTYVRNRVQEIQALTSPDAWRHCPGVDNPADLPSRGASSSALTNDLWTRGPMWLRMHHTQWPARYEDEEVPADCTVEQRKQEVSVNACSTAEDVAGIGQLVPLENYSSLRRLHRVTAWVIRWTKKARREEDTAGDLTQEEIRRAGDLWVAQAQTDAFKDEKARLQSGLDVPGSSDVFQLNPHLDNGFLRVTGRLQESELTAQEKYPLILPSKHRYTKLAILDLHENLCHAGIQQTMFALRSRFWVPRSRQTVRQVIHDCARCRVFRLKPLSQERAPLPKERVCGGAPFSRIGVDLGGPLYFKDGEKSGPVKAYFVLFTCTAVRAVHLELVETLSTEDFLAAFERFVARRGKPIVVFSDNATNFRGAASRLTHLGVTWKFNVPRAPWWGGFFERMVRTTKDALRKTLYKSLMTFSELQTVLCRIEGVINARPLSPLTEDINDVRALSPDDFLRDTSHGSAERAAMDHPETDGEPGRSLGARWRYRRQVLQHLWQRWAREYVRELRVPRRAPNDQPKVGDMVLIGDNMKTSPALWQMGKITQLHQGRDGLIRSATVRTAGGELARPIQRLYPLETA